MATVQLIGSVHLLVQNSKANAKVLNMNPVPVLNIEIIDPKTNPLVIRKIGALRVEVWGDLLNPAAVREGVWLDNHDVTALHWVAMVDHEVVAAARLTLHETVSEIPDWDELGHLSISFGTPIAYMSRLVIKKNYRAPGFADRLRLEEARRLGAQSVLVGPLKARIRPLEKCGFEYIGCSPVTPEAKFALFGCRIQVHIMVNHLFP